MPMVACPEHMGKSSSKIPVTDLSSRERTFVGASVQPTKGNKAHQMLKDQLGMDSKWHSI